MDWVEVRKWVLSGLLVGTVLVGKLTGLLLAEGREAIGSRLRINCIHLPAVLNRTSFKWANREKRGKRGGEGHGMGRCLLSRWEKGWLKEQSPILAIQTLKGWSHQEHGTLLRKAVLPPMQWAGRPLGSALWWQRWEVQQEVTI